MPDCSYLKKLWDDEEEKPKTVFFEERFGVDIREFRSMKDVDEFVERKLGRPLQIVDISKYFHKGAYHRGRGIIYGIIATVMYMTAWLLLMMCISNDMHPIGILGLFIFFASMELGEKAARTLTEDRRKEHTKIRPEVKD